MQTDLVHISTSTLSCHLFDLHGDMTVYTVEDLLRTVCVQLFRQHSADMLSKCKNKTAYYYTTTTYVQHYRFVFLSV